jgi:hypothetical protein
MKSSANMDSSMIMFGLFGIAIVQIYTAVMLLEFTNTDNKIGKGFAILGIYLYSVIYCKFAPPVKLKTGADRFKTV